MFAFGLYLTALLIALTWVALDENALTAFEIFKGHLHASARHMGIYWKWCLPNLVRAGLLLSCVFTGVIVAIWMLLQNPWVLGLPGRATLFAVMLLCAITVLAMPRLAAQLRFRRFLHFKATQLTTLASTLSSDDGVSQQLEPAEVDKFGGAQGWSAWHPRQELWQEGPYWEGLVPVVYVHQNTRTSLIFPIDFDYFLAWNLPQGSITPGELMPFLPTCRVKAILNLFGREGWSVVHADMVLDDSTS